MFSKLKLELLLAVIVSLVIAGTFYAYHRQGVTITKLTTESIAQQLEIKAEKHTLAETITNNATGDEIASTTIKNINIVKKESANNIVKLHNTVNRIKTAPKTPQSANLKLSPSDEIKQISEVRISAVWDAYCQTSDSSECVPEVNT